MKSRNKKVSFKGFQLTLLLILSIIIVFNSNVETVLAYDYIMSGASEGGVASIKEVRGATGKNGYYTAGGYEVNYTITHDWLSFEEMYGGFFYAADAVLPTEGCRFAYHTPSGEIWQNGAIVLGKLVNSVKLAQVNATQETVSYQYTVNSEDDIPAYLAYVYEPAANAYVHITEERGKDAHVWYYHKIKGLAIEKDDKIDTDAPKQEIHVYPEGNTIVIAGKTWAQKARVKCLCIDEKSRPNSMKLYFDQKSYKEYNNVANQVSIEAQEIVANNGKYGVQSIDQLGNSSAITTVSVDYIDADTPQIAAITIDKDAYAKTHCITVIASDTGCGLHEKAYRFNGGDWQAENTFVATANGIIKVEVRDALGNIKTSQYTMDKIDAMAPSIDVELVPTGKEIDMEGLLYTNQMHAKVTAADVVSGISTLALMQKSVSGYETLVKSTKEGRQNDIIESDISKEEECYAYTKDVAQNEVRQELNLEQLDTTPPEMSIDVTAKKEVKNQNKTWTNEYQIAIKTTDMKSRPKTIYCKKDDQIYQTMYNEKCLKTIEGEMPIIQNGSYVFYAEDHLENICNVYNVEISNIDRTAPTISENEYFLAKDNKSIIWEIQATDAESGLDLKAYKFDNGDWQSDNKTIVMKRGVHQVEVRDCLGNTRKIEVVIQVSDEGEVVPTVQKETVEIPTKKPEFTAAQPEATTTQTAKEPSAKKEEDRIPSVIKKQNIVKMQEKLASSNELKIEKKLKPTLSENATKKLKSVKKENKSTPVIIGAVLLLVLISLLLFALMYKYKNTCILYSMYKNKKKDKITRIPIERKNDVWVIEINDACIPNLSIGEYLIKPSRIFIVEQKEEYIFLMINGNAIKVPLEEEITFTL